jgi:chromosome segregation ATPase
MGPSAKKQTPNTSPTYDELADLLKQYTQIIRKSKAKCDKLKDENEFLTAKYDIVVKASEEMKEENKTMSSTENELETSLKDAKEKCEKLNEANRELKDWLVKIKEDYNKIMIIFLLQMSFYLVIHMRLLTLLLRLI